MGGVVDLTDDRVEVLLGQVLEPGSFGQIAADPAVPVLVAATLLGTVRVGEVREHAQRLVHQHVQGRLRAVVPRAVDARGRRHALEYLVLGPGRGGRALVVDEPGEQPAAPALHLRVHAAPRRRGADHRVRLEMAEPLPGSDRLGPVRDGHAHRDARPFRLPALFPRPAFPAARQILAQVQRPLRLGVDPLVKALVADPHRRVAGALGLQPSLDQFRAPPPCAARPAPRREAGPSPCDAACGIRADAGRPFSARPAPNRTDPRSTARSSAVSAGRGGTTRSRWKRTTGRASARGSRWICPGRSSPRSVECSDAVRNAASRSGSSPRTTGANTVDP